MPDYDVFVSHNAKDTARVRRVEALFALDGQITRELVTVSPTAMTSRGSRRY